MADLLKAVKRLGSELRRRGVRHMKLSLASDQVFMNHGHDRHIRFDHHVFDVGQGLKLFSEPLIGQFSTCTCVEDSNAKDKETLLLRKSHLVEQIVSLPGRMNV